MAHYTKRLEKQEDIHRSIDSEQNEDRILTIASLKSELRKEREISSLMRTSLMDVQSQKQELEENIFNFTGDRKNA